MQRLLLSATLAIAAAALAVGITRSPAREAQASAAPEPPSPAREMTPAPERDGLFGRASLDRGTQALGSAQERFLVVELQAPEAATTERQPLHLALVMDSSGSMDGENIANAKRAAQRMVERLGPRDSVSLVRFSTNASTVISQQEVWDRDLLSAAIHGVRAEGNTNLHAGLELGLGQLGGAPRGNRRVVLLSDGLTNRGVTDRATIARAAQRAAAEGVTVSALGLGVQFDGELLHAISAAGGGSYLYAGRSTGLVDSFEDELDRAFTVAVRGARVELALDPALEVLEVYGYDEWDGQATEGGFEAFLGDLSARETRKVVLRCRVPAGEAGERELARARLSWEDPASGERMEEEHAVRLLVSDDRDAVRRGRVPWATVHAATAEVGRHMQWAQQAWDRGDAPQAQRLLERGDARLAELTAGLADPRLDQLDQRIDQQWRRYRDTARDSWEGEDLRISAALESLGYLM